MTVAGIQKFGFSTVILLMAALCGCRPIGDLNRETVTKSNFLVEDARLFDSDQAFSIKANLTYPKAERKGPESISTNISNKLLTKYRCSWCHECGFLSAFDADHFETPEWNPKYKGEAWKPIVYRMNENDETMLNEQIAERIYNYLHDESLGIYDPDKDSGQTRIEVDDLSKLKKGIGAKSEYVNSGADEAAEEGNAGPQPPAEESGSGEAGDS